MRHPLQLARSRTNRNASGYSGDVFASVFSLVLAGSGSATSALDDGFRSPGVVLMWLLLTAIVCVFGGSSSVPFARPGGISRGS